MSAPSSRAFLESRSGPSMPGFPDGVPSAGILVTVAVGCLLLSAIGLTAVAQSSPPRTAHAVEGRVVEKHAAAGIPGLTVELDGSDRLEAGTTSADGGFRFEEIPTGGYTLRVLGRGYRPRAQYVWVEEDVALILPVAAAPVPDEPSGRSGRSPRAGFLPPVDGGVRGVVREGAWGLPLRDAEILTNRGVATRTGHHGRFELPGIPPGAPVLMSVRAFGYMALDTTLVARKGRMHDFQLRRDPAVQRRIRKVMDGLVAGIDGHPGPVHVLGREALLASHQATVAESIAEQHGALARRIRCVVLDDAGARGPDLLSRLAPGDLQRVVLLEEHGGARAVTARIYSRTFVRDLVGGSVEARSFPVTPAEGSTC